MTGRLPDLQYSSMIAAEYSYEGSGTLQAWVVSHSDVHDLHPLPTCSFPLRSSLSQLLPHLRASVMANYLRLEVSLGVRLRRQVEL